MYLCKGNVNRRKYKTIGIMKFNVNYILIACVVVLLLLCALSIIYPNS